MLAGRIARGVAGIADVLNLLTVQAPKMRPGAEIAADVRARLQWDRRIGDQKIDVNVKDGSVVLTGTVGSAAERQWAALNAWVTGVQDVNTDGLKVDQWWDRKSLRRDPSTVVKSDAEIERAIKAALLYDPRVFAFNPEVSVQDRIVTLSGTVENLAASRAAAAVARNTVGVWRVRNLLKVRPGTKLSDAEILKSARLAIRRDPYLNRYQVRLSVQGNSVSLHGTVDSDYERNRVEDAVGQVNGVVGVRNYLKVDIPVITTDAPDITARDNEIREDIEDEMLWSPWVEANGVATLTGIVDTWSESQAATENAFEGGARKVINKLQVRTGPTYTRP